MTQVTNIVVFNDWTKAAGSTYLLDNVVWKELSNVAQSQVFFEEALAAGYAYAQYDNQFTGTPTMETVDSMDATYGNVVEIKNGTFSWLGNAAAEDMTAYANGSLTFDFNVVVPPTDATANYLVKIETEPCPGGCTANVEYMFGTQASLPAGTSLLLSVTNVLAQDDVEEIDPETGYVIEEVTVTSTKRETNLMETPLAVTALSQEDLEKEGVKSALDLSTLVPNLQIGLSPSDSGVQVAIRGITSNNFTELGDPTVAFHFDGLYSPRPQAGLALMHDVERVEINRGPQGTLFGRNSTAGSINVISSRPKFGEFNGNVAIELGDRKQRTFKSWLNIPCFCFK